MEKCGISQKGLHACMRQCFWSVAWIQQHFVKFIQKHIFCIPLNTSPAVAAVAVEILCQISGLGDPEDYPEQRKPSSRLITSLSGATDSSHLFFIPVFKRLLLFLYKTALKTRLTSVYTCLYTQRDTKSPISSKCRLEESVH